MSNGAKRLPRQAAQNGPRKRVPEGRVLEPELVVPDETLPPDLILLRRIARLMDEAVAIPGTGQKAGADALLGLFPLVGDAVAAGTSLFMIYSALRHRVPGPKVAKMAGIVAVDALLGSVPVIGDLFDILWRSNSWNAETVIRYRDGEKPPRRFGEIALAFSLVALVLLGLFAIPFVLLAVLVSRLLA